MARGSSITGAEQRDGSRRIGALRALGPFLKPYLPWVILGGLALMLTAGVSLVLPMAARRVVLSTSNQSATSQQQRAQMSC